MPREFEQPGLGFTRDWATRGPELEILLARESDLPVWTEISPRVFAAPFARIYWNEGAAIHLELAEGMRELPAECFAVIGPETPYIPRLGGSPVRHVHLHVGVLWPWTLRSGVWFLPESDTREARSVLDAMRRSRTVAAEGLRVRALAETVLAALPPEEWSAASADTGITRAVEQIQGDLRNPPGNAALAARLGLSVDAFIRRFRRATGSTPQAFSLHLRLGEAARLLAHGEASIDQVAEEVGFFDRYHFTKAFHLVRGVPPGVWRRYVRGPGANGADTGDEGDGRRSRSLG
jgi:AraC-like DNA-binding protein